MVNLSNVTVISEEEPTLDSPTLVKRGGSITSEALNDWLVKDMKNYSKLLSKYADINEELDITRGVAQIQAQAMSTLLSSLNNTVTSGGYPAVSGVYLDFHSTDGVDNSTTAQIDATYGQAIIPPINSSVSNQLIVKDNANITWVPRETKIYYAYGNGEPSSWTQDTDNKNIKRAFDDKPFTTYRVPTNGNAYIWLKVELPLNLMTSRHTNAIVIHPWPEFGMNLLVAQKAGINQSYTDLYNPGDDTGEYAQKRRWILEPEALTSIRFQFKNTNSLDYIGCYHLACYSYEWQSSAQAVLETSSWNTGSTISSVTIYSPSSTVPIPSYSQTGTQITIPISLLTNEEPQLITAVKVLF